MNRKLVLSVLASMIAAPASAADLPVKAPVGAAPVVAVYNWSGFYLGGFVGGAWPDRDVTTTDVYDDTVLFKYDLGGSFIGGGTIGHNWQPAGSPLVFGIEAEVGYLRFRGSAFSPVSLAQGFSDAPHTTHIGDVYGVVAGRLGYGWSGVLAYVKGGVAFVEKEFSAIDTCTVGPGCGTFTTSVTRSNTDMTWALGGGIEWAWGPAWSVKAEYLYLDTSETFTACGPGGGGSGPVNCAIVSDPAIHTAKIGLNYRFGGLRN